MSFEIEDVTSVIHADGTLAFAPQQKNNKQQVTNCKSA
jgi:hypothetical protein